MSVGVDTSSEEQLLRETARSFIERHAPEDDVKDWDHEGTYPVGLFRAMAELGWYGLSVDEELDGQRAMLMSALCQEVGRASSDLVALFNLTASGIRDVERWGTPAQQERLIDTALRGDVRFSIAVSEPDVGSDSANVKATARPDAGGWILNGQKTYCEGAGLPDTLIAVYARTGDSPRKRDNLSVFLVPADDPGVRIHRMPSLGRNISGVYEVFLEDVRVDGEALLSAPGDGWRILANRLELERILISSGFVGSASRVIEMTAQYANEREQFGQPISAYQGVTHPLAETYVELDAARCAVERTARLWDAGRPCGVESAMAKVLTGKLYAEASARAMEIQGAYGYVRDHTLPMHHSDGIIARVVAGPPSVMLNVVARKLGLGGRR
jgi:alkylation response protein AidB-like acyl-CoA dehydrogenase